MLKSDQEESIIALKKAVAVMRQDPTVNIESPVRDSQANGTAEMAVRTWAAQVRTMTHHLEHRLQHKIPFWSALMTWLVAWAAEVICRYTMQSNGRTNYEIVTGHKGLQPIAISGDRRMLKFTTDKNNRKKMERDRGRVFFLGVNPGTTEYVVGSGDDVFSGATIRRLEEHKAFDPSIIKETKMLYRDYVLEGARPIPVKVRIPTTRTSIVDPAVPLFVAEKSQAQPWRLCAPWIYCRLPGMRATSIEIADSQKSHHRVQKED